MDNRPAGWGATIVTTIVGAMFASLAIGSGESWWSVPLAIGVAFLVGRVIDWSL